MEGYDCVPGQYGADISTEYGGIECTVGEAVRCSEDHGIDVLGVKAGFGRGAFREGFS